MLLTKGEKFLIVCEQYGITVVDIEEAQIVNPTVNNKDFNRLVKLSIPNDNGVNAFAGLSAAGQVKIFTEGEDQDSHENQKWINQVKVLRANMSQVSDLI